MALAQSRFYSNWALSPITERAIVPLSEDPTPELIWRELRFYRDVPEKGRSLFPKAPLAQRNALWREFANYLRQGETYFSTGAQVPGSSAALPYYYSIMNLAKAELLLSNPSAIVGTTVRHGLSFSPA